MGASGWSYFVPYQPDVNKALQDLRQQVFESGKYYKSWRNVEEFSDDFPGLYDKIIDRFSDNQLENFLSNLKRSEKEPGTIKDLLNISGSSGTHSIIDIERVDTRELSEEDEGNHGTIYLYPQKELLDLFETVKPTRAMIEAIEEDEYSYIGDLLPRWRGVYIIYYKDGKPDGYFFSGFSGD